MREIAQGLEYISNMYKAPSLIPSLCATLTSQDFMVYPLVPLSTHWAKNCPAMDPKENRTENISLIRLERE